MLTIIKKIGFSLIWLLLILGIIAVLVIPTIFSDGHGQSRIGMLPIKFIISK